jgi:hypothetical protein
VGKDFADCELRTSVLYNLSPISQTATKRDGRWRRWEGPSMREDVVL